MQLVKVTGIEHFYSPFTGEPAIMNDMANKRDPSLMFVYYGNAGLFDFVSKTMLKRLGKQEDDIDLDNDILRNENLQNMVVFQSDLDWNGLNYYGYSPLLPDS